MKHLFILLCGVFIAAQVHSQHVIRGIVFSDSVNTPLPDVEVSIPDLRILETTNKNGEFTFRNISGDHVLLQCRRLGYKTELIHLYITTDTTIRIVLKESAIEGHEVVVTGNLTGSDHEETSAPVHFMNKDEWREDAPGNVIDAISRTPGVSQVSTGPQVSKPVIRGLSFNRVLVLHDGIRQEGQQWGDEHGVEIDANSADRIEILRGPASLIYGSDAMGGVINILEPFPAPWNSLEGELANEFHFNNLQYNSSLFLQGNRKGMIWRLRSSLKNAGNYRTPSEIVYNSMFNEYDASAMFGFQKKWGYTHNSFSIYRSALGLMEGDRDSLGSFTDHQGNTVSSEMLHGRDFGLPFQTVEHRKWSTRTHILKENYHLDILAGWQQNIREEFEESLDTAGLHFDLYTGTLDLQWHWPRQNGWEYIAGLNGMHQQNKIKGEELLIPNFNTTDAGVFFFLKRTGEKNTFSMGGRYSYRVMNVFETLVDPLGHPDPSGSFKVFNDITHIFHGPSFSIGITSRMKEHVSIKNSLSTGFRAPNPFELYAFGVHEGTQRYEYGNPGLKQEMSLQYDLGFILEKEKIHVEPAFFVNSISHYSYLARMGNAYIVDGLDTLEVFAFLQSTAVLYGAELMVDWHPADLLHVRNVFSWVEGFNTDIPGPLPMIPAPRLVTDIKFEFPEKGTKWSNRYIKLTSDLNAEQYRVANFETPTPMYCLVNAGVGITRKMKHTEIKLRASVQNVFNATYAPHLSRLRYLGINNPGRNIVVGIEIPFEHSKSEQ